MLLAFLFAIAQAVPRLFTHRSSKEVSAAPPPALTSEAAIATNAPPPPTVKGRKPTMQEVRVFR